MDYYWCNEIKNIKTIQPLWVIVSLVVNSASICMIIKAFRRLAYRIIIYSQEFKLLKSKQN